MVLVPVDAKHKTGSRMRERFMTWQPKRKMRKGATLNVIVYKTMLRARQVATHSLWRLAWKELERNASIEHVSDGEPLELSICPPSVLPLCPPLMNNANPSFAGQSSAGNRERTSRA